MNKLHSNGSNLTFRASITKEIALESLKKNKYKECFDKFDFY